MSQKPIENISHYSFFKVSNPESRVQELKDYFYGQPVKGTFLIASEGVNFNASCPIEWEFAKKFQKVLESWGCTEFDFHYSFSDEHPFKRLKILNKPEIVSLKAGPIDVQKHKGPHLRPAEFQKIIHEHERLGDDSPYEIVDMRNDFEYALGSFKGARPAGTSTFREFQNTLDHYPKDKKIVMFCTGGVRCEKASAYLREKGFQEVYQLEGGILKYLTEVGTQDWEGQCFVFDQRRTFR
jgi:UPF0176 protein